MEDTRSESSSTPPPTAPASENRTLMLVLSYLGILALIPLLAEKEDEEVQWHSKQGLILTGVWIAVSLVLSLLSFIPMAACGGCAVLPLLMLVALGIHVFCMVKAIQGERVRLPVVSDLVDKWQ